MRPLSLGLDGWLVGTLTRMDFSTFVVMTLLAAPGWFWGRLTGWIDLWLSDQGRFDMPAGRVGRHRER